MATTDCAAGVREAFRRVDANGDGLIARSELAVLLQKLGDFSDEQIDLMFDTVDASHDGTINYEEFLNWVYAGMATLQPAPHSVAPPAPALELLGDVAAEHRTHGFAQAYKQAEEEEVAGAFDVPRILLRRGGTVSLRATLGKEATTSNGVLLIDGWDATASPVVLPPVSSPENIAQGSCWTESASGYCATLLVRLPPNLPVGEYTLQVLPADEVADAAGGAPAPACKLERVMVLMNPWCEEAQEYLPDPALLDEYVLLESGLMFMGNEEVPVAKGWTFGQFEPGVLAATCKMLRPLPAVDRASPVAVARRAVAMCNSQDDDGVLVGNWSNTFFDGWSPAQFTGSARVLSDWAMYNEPVKYGQCWVFSGVMTSVMRCLGLAARPVTNYGSGWDKSQNRTIDLVFLEDGTRAPESAEQIWNFHVWAEVWMARPDLDHLAVDLASGLGGWQAVDPTPQEVSEGRYQCGPASVAAVRLGLSVPYDTDFLVAAVNADVRRYFRRGGELELASTTSDECGLKILTKEPEKWHGMDIVDTYKAPKGSALERASLQKGAGAAGEAMGSLHLDLHGGQKISVGDNAIVTLTFVPQAGVQYPDALKMSLSVMATEYTGRGRSVLASAEAVLDCAAAAEQGLSVVLNTDAPEFQDVHLGSGFHILAVGAVCSDDGQVAIVKENIAELAVNQVELASVDPPAAVGATSRATMRFRNPFACRALTGVQAAVEGPRLLAGASARGNLKLALPDVEPGGTLEFSVDVVPRRQGTASLLAVTLSSKELDGIHGKWVIEVP